LWHSAAVSLQNVAAVVVRRLPAGARRRLLHGLGRYAPWEAGFDFTPPAPGPGEHVGPPDFVGIGVQKAGTTWWYELIASHPGVASPPGLHKERHFLSRFGTEAFGPAQLRDYHAWFPRRSGLLAGEWTPDYLYYPWVAPLLARAAPAARLLVMVRDPVERFRSGLAHQLRFGAPRTGATVAEAVGRGFYHRALESWFEHFDAGQVLVLQYEACSADPGSNIDRTYRFLGLDDSYRPDRLLAPVSATRSAAKIGIDSDVRRRLIDLYTPDVAALSRRLPDLDLGLWPNFSGQAVP